MKLWMLVLIATTFVVSLSAVQVGTAPRVHLAGDSTMADKPTDPPNPEHGWGQLLPKFFKEPAMIVNHAANGRSTRSFITEGRCAERVAALAVQEIIRLRLP